MRRERRTLSSILAFMLCLSLIVGATYALFTYKSETNIAITSGNVEVVATIENLAVHSPTAIAEDGTITDDTNAAADGVFANGGTAAIVENTLTLTNMTPGDKATFDIRIKNNSTVAVKYRTLLAVSENTGLFSGLNVTVDGKSFGNTLQSGWETLEVDSDDIIVPVEVVLPSTTGNEYREKSVKLSFTVSAVQGNTETVDIDPTVDTLLNEGNATVNIPAGTLAEGQIVKLKVSDNATAPTAVATIDNTVICATDISFVDADGNDVTMPTANYTVTMDIGKDLDATKLAVYHNEEKVESISYNAGTGIVTFTTDSFSPFTAVLEGVGTIATAEELVALRDSVNAGNTKAGNVYTLTADIDLDGVEWTAINNFAGTLDGQGHTISNMTSNLFSTVSGTVKNLNVANITVVNTDKNGANGFIGTVAEGGLVDNCKVSDVTITWDDGKGTTDCWGGIISRVNAGATVQNCKISNVTITADKYVKRSAAIFAEVTGKISGCTVDGVTLKVITKGTIGVNGSDAYTSQVGGIIADLYSGAEVSDCTFNNVTLVIDEATNTGGIVGKAYVTGIEGTHEIALKNITVNGLTMNIGHAVEAKYSAVSNVGGFIGQVDSRNNDAHLTMDNCRITGLNMTLTSKTKGEDPAGGLISSVNAGVDITNCSVSGKIDGTNTVMGIGGFLGEIGGYGANNLAGQKNEGKTYVINITDCSADVEITGNDNILVGGFVSYAGCESYDIALELNFTNCEAKGSFYGKLDSNENEVVTLTGCKVDGVAFSATAVEE